MFEFDKLDNETIENVVDDVLLLKKNNLKSITTVFTNYRVVFLDFINNSSDEDLRISRGVQYFKKKSEIFSFKYEELGKILDSDDGLKKYVLKDNNYFFLKSETFFKLLSEKII